MEKLDGKEGKELVHRVSGCISSDGNLVQFFYTRCWVSHVLLHEQSWSSGHKCTLRAKYTPGMAVGWELHKLLQWFSPLRRRDGEEFTLVRQLHTAGWSWKPEYTFLGQRKRREQLLWPRCSYLLDRFLELSKHFHMDVKKCVLQSRTGDCCPNCSWF